MQIKFADLAQLVVSLVKQAELINRAPAGDGK